MGRNYTLSAFALAAGAMFSSASFGQLIVGNDQTGSASIYNVNVNTGVATAIYTTSTAEAKPWGMAYDPASNTLFWNNGGTLYKSPLSNTLVPQSLGGMTFNGTSINFVALSYYNGKLYGTRNIATEAVYSIDTNTLAATQEYVHPSTFDYGGLEHDQTNGILYGLSDSAPAGSVRGLYEITISPGSDVFRAPYPAGETDIDGLAVNNGLAYYVTDGPNTTQANFYIYKTSGDFVGTLPSPFTGSGTFSAATYAAPIPEPAIAGVIVVIGAICRRRAR